MSRRSRRRRSRTRLPVTAHERDLALERDRQKAERRAQRAAEREFIRRSFAEAECCPIALPDRPGLHPCPLGRVLGHNSYLAGALADVLATDDLAGFPFVVGEEFRTTSEPIRGTLTVRPDEDDFDAPVRPQTVDALRSVLGGMCQTHRRLVEENLLPAIRDQLQVATNRSSIDGHASATPAAAADTT